MTDRLTCLLALAGVGAVSLAYLWWRLPVTWATLGRAVAGVAEKQGGWAHDSQ